MSYLSYRLHVHAPVFCKSACFVQGQAYLRYLLLPETDRLKTGSARF